MDPLSVTASVLALVGTTRAIAALFTTVRATCKEAHKGVEDLQREHSTISNVVESLKTVVEERFKSGVDPEITALIGTIVGDTQATLNELHKRIAKLVPVTTRQKKMATMILRYNYLWNEKALQATMLRLQARKDALSLILNMQSSIDGNGMRKELTVIRKALEDHLNAIRAPDTVSNEIMGDADSIADDARSGNSSAISDRSTSITAPTTFNQSPHGACDDEENTLSVRDLARRFDKALQKGARRGPNGERVQQQLGQLNSARAGAVGAVAQSHSPTGNIRRLVENLSSSEAASSGLSDKKTAEAYQKLAKAYQDAGEYEDALECYHQALVANEFLLGSSHPKTLGLVDCIARIFEIQSRWQDALDYYQQSLEGKQSNETLGPSHPSILDAETKVARILSRTGEPELALGHFASILDRYQAWPNGGTAAALAVRADMAITQLEHGENAAGLLAAEATLAEFSDLKASRNEKFGPNDYRTKEAQNGIDRLTEAILIETSAQPLAVPSANLTVESCSEIEEFERKLEAAVNKYGQYHPETLEVMLTLADAYSRYENYGQAISWFLEVLHGQERILDSKHPTLLTTLHYLGACYAEKGEPITALQYLEKALNGRRVKLAKNHPMTLSTLVQVASVHDTLGDFPKAKESLNLAIAGYEEKFGVLNPHTISAKFQLAKMYSQHDFLTQAETLHQEVLTARLEAQGPNHLLTLSSKFDLAKVYRARGDDAKALPLLNEAYDGQKALFGVTHNSVTQTASQLANLYWETGQPNEALDYYFVMLRNLENDDNENATAGAITMANIALCYRQMEMFENAHSWYERVLKMLDTELGVQHEKSIDAALDLARASLDCEKFDIAIENYQRVLEAREQAPPPDSKETATILFQLGFATSKAGQTERCLYWGQRLLDLQVGVDDVYRIITMRRMGHLYASQDKDEEALKLLQQAMDDAKIAVEEDHWLNARLPEDVQGVQAKIHNRCEDLSDLEKYRQIVRELLERNEPMGVRLLMKLAFVHERQHLQHEALSLLEEALDASQCMPEGSDGYKLKFEIISGIADANLALYNLKAAMKYLQTLVDTEEDTSWKAGALARMVVVQVRESNFDEAIAISVRQLRESERESGMYSVETLELVTQIARLYSRLGKPQDALKWAERGLAGFRRCEAPDAKVQESTTLGLLSDIHYSTGDLQQARTAKEACVRGLEAELGFDNEISLSESLDLADIYAVLGLEDEALWLYHRVVDCNKAKLETMRPNGVDKAAQMIRRLEGKRSKTGAAAGSR